MFSRGGVAPVVQHLPGKCEALNSNPSTAKGRGERGERKYFQVTPSKEEKS
jgi:hypothetical protein